MRKRAQLASGALRVSTVGFGLLLASAQAAWAQVSAFQPQTTRVSVATDGTQANGSHIFSGIAVSADGRFVAFESPATNLVAGDTNSLRDIFVRDRTAGTTTRASVASGGAQATGFTPVFFPGAFEPALSADGRFVAFSSDATNLVAGDNNARFDIFLHDRTNVITTRESVASGGAQAAGGPPAAGSSFPDISPDARFVAFMSRATNLVSNDTNDRADVFVHDRQTGATTRASVSTFQVLGGGNVQGNGDSTIPAISADGRFIAFTSDASNLVGGDSNAASDVFVRDRQTGATTRVSTGALGQANGASSGAAISDDGRFVAFRSDASNLVAGDTNGTTDVFVRDRTNATTARISLASGNVQANGSSGSTPSITADGRFVAFQSQASNLVAGDSNGQGDIFLRDRINETTARVSVSTSGVQANASSVNVKISGDGRFVPFTSEATNLVAGDTNGRSDVFLRDRGLFSGFAGSWERVGLRCSRRPPRRCTVFGRLEITNPGRLTARSSRVSFYLSKNRRLDRRDRLIKRISLARLKGDATRTVRLKRRLSRDVSRRFVIARLDATNKVKEPNEKDNVVVSERLSRKRIRLRVRGGAKLGAPSSITVKVTNAKRRPLRNANVTVAGAGVERVTGRTGRNGTLRFTVTAPQSGKVKVRASRRGYASATAYRRVR